MEVLQKTPTKLILRHQPLGLWVLAGICVLVIPFLLVAIALTNTWIFYLFWFPFLPIFFIFIGFLIGVYAGKIVTCSFDKVLGILTIKRRGLRQTKVIEYPIRDIIDVELDSRRRDELTNQTIVLVLRTGHAQPLNLNNNANWQDKQATLEIIRDFLGLPKKQFYK